MKGKGKREHDIVSNTGGGTELVSCTVIVGVEDNECDKEKSVPLPFP